MSDLTIIYSHGMCGYGRLGFLDRRFVDGLRSTGIDTRVNDWARHANPLRNLHDRDQHGRAAEALLKLVANVRTERPDHRIALVGHSTGCLVMLEAMRQLDAPVDFTLMMAAAVDPEYNLASVDHAAEQIVHYYSRLDLIACGVGTWIVGTADLRHRPAAGWAGFNRKNCEDCGIDQHAWRPGWMRHGHLGLHVGYLDPKFAAGVVVPHLLGRPNVVSGHVDPATSG